MQESSQTPKIQPTGYKLVKLFSCKHMESSSKRKDHGDHKALDTEGRTAGAEAENLTVGPGASSTAHYSQVSEHNLIFPAGV